MFTSFDVLFGMYQALPVFQSPRTGIPFLVIILKYRWARALIFLNRTAANNGTIEAARSIEQVAESATSPG
jgi:hypothetical protein